MYNVLIADDEEIIRRGLKGFVEKEEGFTVISSAEDGQEALEMAKESMPDLCLVDINMPFVNGLDFIERLKKINPDACVVVITGYDDFSYIQRALQLHVFDYLLKPVNEQNFHSVMEKIREHLDDRERNKNILNWSQQTAEQHEEVQRRSDSYSEKVSAALSHIDENYSDEMLSLNETADLLHVSPPYLSKIFKEETGDTFQNYLQRLRLRRAAELLKDENNMVKEIAESCGYSSQHYFSAAFKKETGMSPAEYRKGFIKRK